MGGIALRFPSGQQAHAGRPGQIATRETNMKIIDVPQSGHLGTFISFKNRFGQFRRRYVVPKDPRTPAQIGVRSRFGRVSARWRVLTDEQRAAWTAFAAEVSSRGRLGKSGPLTGCQLFVKVNVALTNRGQPQVDLPPPCPGFPDLAIANLYCLRRFGQPPVGPILFLQAHRLIDAWRHDPRKHTALLPAPT